MSDARKWEDSLWEKKFLHQNWDEPARDLVRKVKKTELPTAGVKIALSVWSFSPTYGKAELSSTW